MSLNHIRTSNNGYALPKKFTGRITCGSNIANFTAIRGQDGSIVLTIIENLLVNLTAPAVELNLSILGDIGESLDDDIRSILSNNQIVPINIGGPFVNEIGCLIVSARTTNVTTGLPFSVRRNDNVQFPVGFYQIFTPHTTVKFVNSLY